MAQYLIQDTTLTNMANKIRSISDGSSEQYTAMQMVTELGNMESEIDTQTDLIIELIDAINNLPDAGSGTPEALEALCDWTTMVDSGSNLIAIVRNLHPTHTLYCTIAAYLGSDEDGWEYEDEWNYEIEPDYGEISWSSGEELGQGGSGVRLGIFDMRWEA